MVVVKVHRIIVVIALITVGAFARGSEPLFVAPLSPEYTLSSPEEFANEVAELRRRIGQSEGVQVGFSTFLNIRFSEADLNTPIDVARMQPTLTDLELIISRARLHQLPFTFPSLPLSFMTIT